MADGVHNATKSTKAANPPYDWTLTHSFDYGEYTSLRALSETRIVRYHSEISQKPHYPGTPVIQGRAERRYAPSIYSDVTDSNPVAAGSVGVTQVQQTLPDMTSQTQVGVA
jgi:hypothetical protein